MAKEEIVKFVDVPKEDTSGPDIIVLKFADSKIPVFKETRNKDYIKYGEDNLYPEYLNFLFNKSAKHNAIIIGKANYVFGKGYENGGVIINRLNESVNDIAKKCILDITIHGGFKVEVVWNMAGKVAEIYHVDYSCMRKGKEGGFYYKESWKLDNRDEEEFIPAFNPAEPKGTQIFEYNEYRPGIRFYPLPDYIGCNNYIETDIEISKYYLSAIRNGMMPSKMVQFYQGDVTDEKKREIESRFGKKFAGAENAGRFIMVFNSSKDKTVDIQDLSASEVDKQFVELNKTCQQEIFSGHLVTSPMLFGIMEPGKLGGGTELNTAYSIFQNTYSKPKAKAFDKELNYLLKFSIIPGVYELQPTDPIGVQFDVKDVVNSLPKQFVFEILGVPKEMWALENIGSDNRPTPTIPIAPPTDISVPTDISAPTVMANDNIKNLSAKQHQQVMRIIRQYGQGKLLGPAAKALLRAGYGLTEDDINSLLGIQAPAKMSFAEQQDEILAYFDACGDSKNDYEILKSKRVSFNTDLYCEGDEEVFIKEAFKSYDVTYTEDKIIQLIKKDPLISAETIATTIGETVAFVESKIESLIARGYIEQAIENVGLDEIIKRTVIDGSSISIPPIKKNQVNPTQIFIKYSYEGPQDNRNRPFCAKMLQLNRLYDRAQIEQFTQRFGYSVFDRRGGFWNKGHGVISESCRHNWKSNIIIKKGGGNV